MWLRVLRLGGRQGANVPIDGSLGRDWAFAKIDPAPEELTGVMLWVDDDGWLSSLEVVDVAEKHGEFNFLPPPSMFEPPKVGEPPTTVT